MGTGVVCRDPPPKEVMGPELSRKGLNGCSPGEGEEVVPGKGSSVGTRIRRRLRTTRNIKCKAGDTTERPSTHRTARVCVCVCVCVGVCEMSGEERDVKIW